MISAGNAGREQWQTIIEEGTHIGPRIEKKGDISRGNIRKVVPFYLASGPSHAGLFPCIKGINQATGGHKVRNGLSKLMRLQPRQTFGTVPPVKYSLYL